MGWDRKAGNKKYYYRSRRVSDKPHPIKLYFGRGAAAHLAAAAVEQRRNERQKAKAEVQVERDATAEADRLAEELRSWTRTLTTAWLVLAGLHNHKGCWRMKRG